MCYVDYFAMFYSNVYNIVYNDFDNTISVYRASAWHILHIDMFLLEPSIQTVVLYCIVLYCQPFINRSLNGFMVSGWGEGGGGQ